MLRSQVGMATTGRGSGLGHAPRRHLRRRRLAVQRRLRRLGERRRRLHLSILGGRLRGRQAGVQSQRAGAPLRGRGCRKRSKVVVSSTWARVMPALRPGWQAGERAPELPAFGRTSSRSAMAASRSARAAAVFWRSTRRNLCVTLLTPSSGSCTGQGRGTVGCLWMGLGMADSLPTEAAAASTSTSPAHPHGSAP